MNQDSSIEISIVANGFVVRPARDSGSYVAMQEMHVFPSMNDLSKWLFDHFCDHHAKPNDKGKRK